MAFILVLCYYQLAEHSHYHLNKEYVPSKEPKTFDEAIAGQNEHLVQIDNQQENEFIWRTIDEPAFCEIRLGGNHHT